MLHDSGFCILRVGDEQSSRRHVVLNYGKGNRGHGHMDKLAVNLITYGYDLSADLGYPPSWVAPKKDGWETHTASHFTALIDGRNQVFATGSLNLFVDGPWGAPGGCVWRAGLSRSRGPVPPGRWRSSRWTKSGHIWSICSGLQVARSTITPSTAWREDNAERFEIALEDGAAPDRAGGRDAGRGGRPVRRGARVRVREGRGDVPDGWRVQGRPGERKKGAPASGST